MKVLFVKDNQHVWQSKYLMIWDHLLRFISSYKQLMSSNKSSVIKINQKAIHIFSTRTCNQSMCRSTKQSAMHMNLWELTIYKSSLPADRVNFHWWLQHKIDIANHCKTANRSRRSKASARTKLIDGIKMLWALCI